MLNKRFPEKRAFITGGASGLGLAYAKKLASDKWRVAIADINEQRLAEAKVELEQLGGVVITMVVDVTSKEQQQNAADQLEQAWGGVDLVFNNAGIGSCGKLNEHDDEEWHRVINIDLWSVIHGCRIFAPLLKKNGGGHIINTASSAGTLCLAEMAGYNVAKSGVVALSETLNVELSTDNIGVTVVCPTVLKTNISESMKGETNFEKNIAQQINESKFTPEMVADSTFKGILGNKLYVMPQADARWVWTFKRWMPEKFTKLMTFLYKNRKWIYSHLD
ncbi:SDR family NAD(P)-dependent oxidoreductase [Thalassotalea fonticola]|uniref:SDR family NAD(P)-dependent oxidoreductase n=1 Tax=Thalassotalea fonticola TaxID=3065649 RepID=A0ABZ0GS44_9GAMM|nr:SDR family NAD(P)-dependent oxidoreductase [Colwelliaceae bacterium S1-1]